MTSKAYLKPQDLNSKILNIDVFEGRVDGVVGEGINVPNLYSGYENEVLNLRDLEVSLQQAQRLKSKDVYFELFASEKNGYTVVKIINKKNTKKYNGNIGINNYGNEKTGKYQFHTNINYENLFNLSDIVSLNLSSTNHLFKSNNKTLGYSVSYSIPYNRFLFDFSYDYSNYKQVNSDEFGYLFYSNGYNNSKSMNVSYKAYHSQNSNLEFKIGYQHKKSKNFFDDVEIGLQSYSSSSFSFGIKHSYMADSFSYYSILSFQKGLGGQKDNKSLQDLHYEKYLLDMSLNKYLLPKYNLMYNLYLHGQYSKDNLFGGDEMFVGGIYSVRGFKEATIAGNKGFYVRQERRI